MTKAYLYPWMKKVVDILPEQADYNKDGSFLEINSDDYSLTFQEFGENDFMIMGCKDEEEIEFNENCGSYQFWQVLDIVKQYFPKE